VVDWNTSIPRLRREFEEGAQKFGKIPQGIDVIPVTVDGIPAEWIQPTGATHERVILFTHGGGYVTGSCADHRMHVAKVVQGCGVVALLFDYRLAPEHPFPAALEDAVKAYRWLLAQGVPPAGIVIVGDSAGGGLALATLLALRDQGVPLPAAAVAVSPWTDLACTGESYRTKARVAIDTPGSWTVWGSYYYKGSDPRLPLISPLYGDLHGLPPILIEVGEDEVLRDDSIRFAARAREAGVDVTLRVAQGMVHCYPFFAPLFPEARQAMDEICSFVKAQANAGKWVGQFTAPFPVPAM
jgi:acetyl esterase/lipase